MKTRTKVLIGTGTVLVVLVVILFFFVRYQVRKSFPEVTGSLPLARLTGPVDVCRDEFGVPHIIAGNEHDLMIAQGYIHAQDRLWQMDLGRHAGQGRLAELFGSRLVPIDRMFRIVGIQRTAEVLERALTEESRLRLQWYADGVNAFIASHKGRYPIEFDMLQYDPEPWSPVHSLLVARMMAWELNLGWWTDLTMGGIAERVGLQKAVEIFPSYPATVPPTVPAREWEKSLSLGSGYLKTAQEYCALFGRASTLGGSNAWVIANKRSSTGGALLANDTHLQLSLPSHWYEVLLRTPAYCVRGMSIPGSPGVVAGRNDSIAWGMTSLMPDEADFYVETIDTVQGGRYLYNGMWRPLEIEEQQIQVRGDTVVPLIIRRTHHGPIISDIRTLLQRYSYPHEVSMRWTGYETDDPIEAFHIINEATNWAEFNEGLRHFAVPGQNFVYCDVRGNIGYRSAVRLPIRGKQSSLLPLPGWETSSEWKGFVPFDRLPALFNPPEGYIATANNKPVDDSYPYYISDLWEPPSRILRLREMLGSGRDRFSVEDCERLQTDKFSHFAMETLPYIFAACRDSVLGIPDEERVFEYLRNWNFSFSRDDIATSIFQQFYVNLLRNIYRDELGDDLFHDYVLLTNIPVRVTAKLFQDGTSSWFDDVSTATVETRDDIIRKSLREAILMLQDRLGKDMKTWRWGSLHTVTLRHPFGLVKPLERLFNIGPFPFDGGSTALISGEYSYNEPFGVTVGPSFRQVFDMANPREVRAVLPSGQSGQVFHPHYGDQTTLWLNGGYRIARMDEASGRWDRLRLEPAR